MSLINNLTDKLDEMLSIFEGVFGFNEAVVAVDKLIYDALSDVICKELNIDKPYIRVKDMKPNHYGEYNPNNNCISLNKLLSPTSYMLIGEDDKALEHMSTLAHELRHVYQHKYNASILDNYIEEILLEMRKMNYPTQIEFRFTGGGALKYREIFERRFNAYISDFAVWENVRGLYLLSEVVWK